MSGSKLPFLIGIAGNSGSGKDTAAVYMENQIDNCYIEHFADPLKKACAEAFGIFLNDFYDPAAKEVINDFWNTTPRKIAQFVGTDLFRHHISDLLKTFDGTFWIRRMYGKLSGEQRGDTDGDYGPSDTVIIPDVRFPDEAEFILSNNGIVIHLTRPGFSGNIGIPNHASENSLKLTPNPNIFNISNDGTLEELYLKLDKIIDEHFPTLDTPF